MRRVVGRQRRAVVVVSGKRKEAVLANASGGGDVVKKESKKEKVSACDEQKRRLTHQCLVKQWHVSNSSLRSHCVLLATCASRHARLRLRGSTLVAGLWRGSESPGRGNGPRSRGSEKRRRRLGTG